MQCLQPGTAAATVDARSRGPIGSPASFQELSAPPAVRCRRGPRRGARRGLAGSADPTGNQRGPASRFPGRSPFPILAHGRPLGSSCTVNIDAVRRRPRDPRVGVRLRAFVARPTTEPVSPLNMRPRRRLPCVSAIPSRPDRFAPLRFDLSRTSHAERTATVRPPRRRAQDLRRCAPRRVDCIGRGGHHPRSSAVPVAGRMVGSSAWTVGGAERYMFE